MHRIFEPAKPHNLSLKNRIFRSATWDGLAAPEGSLTDALGQNCRKEGG